NLTAINPDVHICTHKVVLDKSNIMEIFGETELLIEAVDRAETKSLLIDTWLGSRNGKWIVAASGIGGYGKTDDIKAVRKGRLVICGDHSRDSLPEKAGLMAPRVWMVACMQANEALEILLGRDRENLP
ncbi:MAG: hypothetical protein JXA66_05060, partial [Oligoflexia bacterium]|nr:hypothetical protein [Oligoflexia bacterium]